jgi:DNA-binding NarL/FixJ family response regulator
VREVASGGGVMGSQIAKKVMNYFSKEKPITPSDEFQLTKRELEVSSLLVKGLVVKDIASQLFLSVDTIKFHIKNIYNKLQVNNRASFLEKYKR